MRWLISNGNVSEWLAVNAPSSPTSDPDAGQASVQTPGAALPIDDPRPLRVTARNLSFVALAERKRRDARWANAFRNQGGIVVTEVGLNHRRSPGPTGELDHMQDLDAEIMERTQGEAARIVGLDHEITHVPLIRLDGSEPLEQLCA